MSDLTLISTDDMLEELNKRHDAFVYAYVCNLNHTKEASGCGYHGGKFTCIGLAEHIKEHLLREVVAEGDSK